MKSCLHTIKRLCTSISNGNSQIPASLTNKQLNKYRVDKNLQQILDIKLEQIEPTCLMRILNHNPGR